MGMVIPCTEPARSPPLEGGLEALRAVMTMGKEKASRLKVREADPPALR